jgi:hypothetical protein
MSLSSVVGAISPVLGQALNLVVPGGSLLVSAIAHLFGVSSTDETAITNAIAADPMAAEKLQEFAITHKYDLEQLTAQDRASARVMNIETTKALGKSDYMIHFLAFFVFALLGAYIILGYFIPAPFDKGVMHDLINLAMLPLSFFYGGMYIQARSSQNKDNDINLPSPGQTTRG